MSTLKFVKLSNFAKKLNCLNLGPELPYLGMLGGRIEKTFVIFEISNLKFFKL